jgi:hypothetical protein
MRNRFICTVQYMELREFRNTGVGGGGRRTDRYIFEGKITYLRLRIKCQNTFVQIFIDDGDRWILVWNYKQNNGSEKGILVITIKRRAR